MSILLIDDEKLIERADVVARTFEDGIEKLSNAKWDELLLDNYLGVNDPKKTGVYVIIWLLEHPEYQPKKITVVSSNPEVLAEFIEETLDYERESDITFIKKE